MKTGADTILVTGAAGFIGSSLAERLLAAGHTVVGLDNFDSFYDPEVKRGNLAVALADPNYRMVEGDIRDRETLDRLFSGTSFGTVVHLAARAGVRPSIADPQLYTSVNLVGTTCLLEACRLHRIDRFLFGSSSSVYGNNAKVPFAEDDPVDHPISPYAATKKAGEVLCHAHHHLFGLKVACLRFFTVYGPRQRPEMAIHHFTRSIAGGLSISQFGDGSSARDYTYIDDIVEGIIAAMDHLSGYHIWNLGGSRTVTLAGLIEMISTRLNRDADIDIKPMQPGDVDRTWADTTRSREELSWEPRIGIEEGLDRFVAWFRSHNRGPKSRS